MEVYIIVYKYVNNMYHYESKVSQEGYRTLAEAQDFIMKRANNPTRITDFLYHTDKNEQYRIEVVTIL